MLGALLTSGWGATQSVDSVTEVDNPLQSYPNRDWEQVYHDIYAYDSVDWTVCHPNCTQSCALNFYMKNGVPIRAEQIYHEEEGSPGPGSPGGYEQANVSRHWNPRGCMKGLTLHRRTFEPSRIKYPMVRKGWDPDDPNPEGRGEDEFERVSWDEAVDLIAEKMANLEDEKRFHVFNAIKADGLITRHGSARRLASIFGGCEWTEYDWYADLPPGHVMTTGYQTSDSDASAWRAADYTIMQEKNLIHNKLADNHWLQETRERGGKMVGVYPDYSPTVQKCDRWLPIRPGSDPAFALGVAHVIIDEELYDADFMRKFTSLPLLVRRDTGKYLRAHEVFGDHDPPEGGTEGEAGLAHHCGDDDWGDFVAVDGAGDLFAVAREDVGEETPATARLEVDREVTLADDSTVPVHTDFTRQKANILENYDPETVEDITTIPADKLRQTAREFADAEKGQWFTGEGINHWFHSNDALQRTIFFVQSMLGNIGERGAVLVTTPDPAAVGDTVRSETLFGEESVPVLGVVANMTAATCPDCGTEHSVFPTTEVGAAFDAPVLDSFPVDPTLADPATAGERAADLAAAVDDALATEPTPPGALDLRGVPARAAREQLRAERRALAPGESLRVVTTDPGAVGEALPDSTPVVDRLGPERWLVEVTASDAEGADPRPEVAAGDAE